MIRREIESRDYTITNPYVDLKDFFVIGGDSISCGIKKTKPLKQSPKDANKKEKAKRRMSKQSRKRNR